MGTTSITFNSKVDKIDKIHQKDAKTTTKSLGFRVTGYILKDKKGEILEKTYKPHGKAMEEHIPGIIT